MNFKELRTTITDAKLPHLDKVLDTELVLQKFKSDFAEQFSAQKLEPIGCSIERIQHKRGKRCRVLYRLRLVNQDKTESEQWFLGKLVKPGQAQGQFATARRSHELANGAWPAVSLWEDWDVVLWTFPNDPEMRKLRIAADPAFIRSFISENISKFGYDLNWRCTQATVKRVKYMPGKRCVLRIEAELLKKTGETETLRLYSKTYPDGQI